MLKRLNTYLKQIQMMVQDTLVYRANFIFRFINWFIRFFIIVFLWTSIYQSNSIAEEGIAGFDLSDTVTYFILIQMVTALTFSRAGFMVSNDIQSGELSGKLVLPVHYLYLRMARDFGQNALFFAINIILYGVALLLFKDLLNVNLEWVHLLIALPLMLAGYIISFCMIVCIGLLAFWLSTATRLIFVYFAIHSLVSGFLIPLRFFPEWVQEILKWTPFPYNYYFPTEILQSSAWSSELTFGVIMTLSYMLVLLALMHFVYWLGLKKYEAVGN